MNSVRMINRDCCVLCKKNNFSKIRKFSKFPVYMGTHEKNNDYQFSDMVWVSCDNCGLVQLSKLVPLEIVYAKSHNTAIGKTWEKHHNTFSEFCNNFIYGSIAEVGGGNLYIANNICKNKNVIDYNVYDSNIFMENKISKKINCSEGIFQIDKIKERFDFVVHSHTLEHFYNPVDELKKIRNILKPNGKMIFSVPNLEGMLKKYYTNTLEFEHTFYLNKEILINMLNTAGFKIEKIIDYPSDDMQDYCYFVYCSKSKPNNDIKFEFNVNIKNIFLNFLDHHDNVIKDLNQLLKNEKNKYIFGAHIFTQYLIEFGLNNEFICVLDNDVKKQGQYLYGYDLIVNSPTILKNVDNPTVVLRAGQFNNEIKHQILKEINSKVRFLE